MVGMAQFSQASFEQFARSATDKLGITPQEAISVYESIILPKGATSGSAGYDFFTPVKIELAPGESLSVPTGIRARIDEGWVLMLYPRSGLGFKYGMKLANTVGVIDSDYYYSDNEGHIIAKITNTSADKTITVEAGKGFIQGVFTPFGITVDDEADGVRNGGFGSTTK